MANYIARHGSRGYFLGEFRMRIRAFRLLSHACVGARRMRVRHRAFRENAQCMRMRTARACRVRTRVARAPYALAFRTLSVFEARRAARAAHDGPPASRRRRPPCRMQRAPLRACNIRRCRRRKLLFSVTIFRVGVKLLFLY